MIRSATSHYCRVRKFMEGVKQAVLDAPGLPDENTRVLRARLILEEALETCDALGVRVTEGRGETDLTLGDNFDKLNFDVFTDETEETKKEPDLVQIADGCADISVVTTGTLVSCGISDGPLLREVDDNNLLKLAKGTVDAHGKLTKHPDHPAPNISTVLKVQGYRP